MSLTVRDVRHAYRGEPVLRGVTLTLPAGASLAVTGPSGSGKTTLLSIVGGLLAPAAGQVSIGGVPAAAFARSHPGGIAWVFQTTNALGSRTLLDNVMLGALVRGARVAEARDRALDAIAAVGLAGREGSLARELSGGELQRASIARAVAARPTLVLADEPTGQLDATTSAVVADVLLSVTSGEAMLVVASHDPCLAARCGTVVLLDDGRTVPGVA